MLSVLLSFLSLLGLSQSALQSLRCEDGVDNKIHLHDLFKGKKNIEFEDVVVLTYDNNKVPSCAEGKGKKYEGRIFFPGFIRFTSGKVHVKEAISVTDNLTLLYTLEKNNVFIGDVCKNGKSVNAFVEDDTCFQNVLPLTGKEVWKQFEQAGVYDINELPGSWTELIPVNIDNEYLDGEWKVSIKLRMDKKVIAGFSLEKKDTWVNVVTEKGLREQEEFEREQQKKGEL